MSTILDLHVIYKNLHNLEISENQEKEPVGFQRRHSTSPVTLCNSKFNSCNADHLRGDSASWLLSSHWSQDPEPKGKSDPFQTTFRADRSISLTESCMPGLGSAKGQVPPPPGFPPLKPAIPVLSNRYKTELCNTFQEMGFCKYGAKCQFAHGLEELRVLNRHPKYKTEFCYKYRMYGACPYGSRCNFIHDPEEERLSMGTRPEPHRLRQSVSYHGAPGPRSTSPPGLLELSAFTRAPSVSPPPSDLLSPTFYGTALPSHPGRHSTRLHSEPLPQFFMHSQPTCCSCRCGKGMSPPASAKALPLAASLHTQNNFFPSQQVMTRVPSANSLSDQDGYSSCSSLSGSESPVSDLGTCSSSGANKRLPAFSRLSISD
ncbi:mRNA decay activator protein ZFP36 [Latimeria chalumnae]|uniref:mRNA decay activator protein ZFP36 n=1 Tax=Latimeria chalumnae TaxID=7897 RepID=H3B8B8_LATCH|nr:PREDICTED: tristetraprolin-like [Latimeria chalumnae]|eukprot:XP_014348939.1 PREDICTED: tristetraprolin-like [Latimeria chalumnae]